jgi:methylated-DNA-protein-cysteine methyltransferase related protein
MAPVPSDAERLNQLHDMSNANAIFAVIRAIPRGKVATYGQVALLAGLPRAARLVGYALRGLPDQTTLPWHRVINAAGKIALPAGSPGFCEQVMRLTAEGIVVKNGRIPLAQYQWQPTHARL